MSSFGPPGVSSAAVHPSLPARPPPSAAGTSTPGTISAPPSGPSAYASSTPTSYGPSGPSAGAAVGAGLQSQPRLSYSRTFTRPNMGGGRGYTNGYDAYSQAPPEQQPHQPLQQPYQRSYGAAQSYGPQYGSVAEAPPQIRNPFPDPSLQQQYGYAQDPQTAAQIASWQDAYMPKDQGAGSGGMAGGMASSAGNAAAGSYRSAYDPSAPSVPDASSYGASASSTAYGPSVSDVAAGTASAGMGAGGGSSGPLADKSRTVYRSGGGKKWADDSLLEWDPSHLRLFVGNLAGEVTDEMLFKAFSRWSSVQKALVKRDKWTKKSRGYGFVSFSDADDFFQAAKEMNGKYIGSHPVVVRKSTTEIKVAQVKGDKRAGKKGGHAAGDGGKPKKSAGSGADYGRRDAYEPAGPHSAGTHKSGQKTKGGLKLLG